jgi:hypothetical protein
MIGVVVASTNLVQMIDMNGKHIWLIKATGDIGYSKSSPQIQFSRGCNHLIGWKTGAVANRMDQSGHLPMIKKQSQPQALGLSAALGPGAGRGLAS